MKKLAFYRKLLFLSFEARKYWVDFRLLAPGCTKMHKNGLGCKHPTSGCRCKMVPQLCKFFQNLHPRMQVGNLGVYLFQILNCIFTNCYLAVSADFKISFQKTQIILLRTNFIDCHTFFFNLRKKKSKGQVWGKFGAKSLLKGQGFVNLPHARASWGLGQMEIWKGKFCQNLPHTGQVDNPVLLRELYL